MMSRTSRDDHPRALRTRPLAARALSTGLCAALVSAAIVTSAPAAATPLPILRLAPDEAPASVLGLDGKDSKANQSLTAALRKAFANRGLSGGEEISLQEMRLTMGCANDGVACLSEGGKTLGVRRLVFGYLEPSGSGYQLDIQILDVETGELQANASMQLEKGDLADGALEQTATDIVNTLMPTDTSDAEIPPRPDPLPEVEEEVEPEVEETPREGGVYFGLEKPTPGWKWAGFGTSLGLTVLAGGATIGMAVWLTAENLGFRKKLLDEANRSLTDDKTINDVPSTLPEGVNLCDYARARPTDETGMELGEPGQVRNARIVKVCDDGDSVRRIQTGVGIGTAVFGVATLAFTGLLLIHKKKPTADAMLRRGLRIGIAPNPGGGMSFAGRLRF